MAKKDRRIEVAVRKNGHSFGPPVTIMSDSYRHATHRAYVLNREEWSMYAGTSDSERATYALKVRSRTSGVEHWTGRTLYLDADRNLVDYWGRPVEVEDGGSPEPDVMMPGSGFCEIVPWR